MSSRLESVKLYTAHKSFAFTAFSRPTHRTMPHQNQPKARSPLSPEPWRTRAQMNSHFTKRWTWMMPERLREWSSRLGCFIGAQRQFSAHSMPLLCPCERTGQVGPVLETDLTIEGCTKNSLCRLKPKNLGQRVLHKHTPIPSRTLRWNTPSLLRVIYYLVRFVIFKFLFPLFVMMCSYDSFLFKI